MVHCCNQVWMSNGGQIPWNAIPICETFKSDGKTPYERRFGEPLKGPIIPLGWLVEYYTISAKDQSRIHQFGKKVFPGLFLGYALYAAGILEGWHMDCRPWGGGDGGRIGNLLEKTQCERGDISQTRRIYFPIADGRIKTRGGDQDLRTSTLIRDRPFRGESHRDFLGESEGSPLSPPQDSYPDAGEAINDICSMSGNFQNRHHVEPRVKLYSPREESFPIPLKYIDVSRTTHTNLDVKRKKRIDDYWKIDGSRDLSDPQGMELILCRVVDSSCLLTHNIVPHISWHDTYSDFPSIIIFRLLLRKFWIQTWFFSCLQYLCLFHIVFECTPGKHDQGNMLALPNRLLCWVLSTSD